MQAVVSPVQRHQRVLRESQATLVRISTRRCVSLICGIRKRNNHVVRVVSAEKENADQCLVVAAGLRGERADGADMPQGTHHAERSQRATTPAKEIPAGLRHGQYLLTFASDIAMTT